MIVLGVSPFGDLTDDEAARLSGLSRSKSVYIRRKIVNKNAPVGAKPANGTKSCLPYNLISVYLISCDLYKLGVEVEEAVNIAKNCVINDNDGRWSFRKEVGGACIEYNGWV